MTVSEAMAKLLGFEIPCDPISLLQNPEAYLKNKEHIELVYALRRVLEEDRG